MALVPDGLPVLSRGRHKSPVRGACFMEYTALLAGEPFSDAPGCTDAQLAAVLRLYGHGGDVDRLFWHLMREPTVLATSAEWVERVVQRLELLHACYEQAMDDLG